MTTEQIKKVITAKCIGVFGAPVIPWDIDSIAEAILKGAERYHVDAVLALAQGILECHFGCNPVAIRSRKTKNIFNVGNVDNGGNRFFKTFEAGIDAYFRLMAREYCWRAEGNEVTVEMMVKHNFKRPRGGRYATALDYTAKVAGIAASIRKMLGESGERKVESGAALDSELRVESKELREELGVQPAGTPADPSDREVGTPVPETAVADKTAVVGQKGKRAKGQKGRK